MARVLSPERAKAFYDRFGKKQDAQGFYEDRALELLVTHASFSSARQVFELGCGTGRFARSLLDGPLPQDASYVGADLSTTMVRLAAERLRPLAARAVVVQASAEGALPIADSTVDRFVSTYVLDLLSPDAIRRVLSEAHRVLAPEGALCLVGVTPGRSLLSGVVMAGWSLVQRTAPALVGGCRPLVLLDDLDPTLWEVGFHQVSESYLVASEVLVASPRPRRS